MEIGVDDHWKLILRATPAENFPLLHRMHDYYDDACFTSDELARLRGELDAVRTEHQRVLIDAIVGIINAAEARGCELHALAD